MGGPQSDDTFEDSRGWCCAAYNEVAIDYNAGFTGALARLVDYYKDQKLFSDCSLDLGWEHPNATLVSLTFLVQEQGSKFQLDTTLFVTALTPFILSACSMSQILGLANTLSKFNVRCEVVVFK